MQVKDAIAEILQLEGVNTIIGYPVNPLFDAAASVGIRTLIVRQERIGVHMADAYSRLRSGQDVGVFTMQHGPGAENSFGAIAQAYADSAPIIVIAGGYAREQTNVTPSFSSLLNYQHITKLCEQVTTPAALPAVMRRAFSAIRNGRPGPVLIEIPRDLWTETVPDTASYVPVAASLSAPSPTEIEAVARTLVEARAPILYAGQGVHYSRAWDHLRALVELLEIPVTTSLEGKSAFAENHPLSLGSGGRSLTGPLYEHLLDCDVILGIGASFSQTDYGISFPKDRTVIHNTIDAADLNKNLYATHGLLGDAGLTLLALIDAVGERLGRSPRGILKERASRIATQREHWLTKWLPKLSSEDVPLSPYRVISELHNAVDIQNTVITHDAGSPRDQLSPFWVTTAPLTYIGWGKTTQLGYGLGLALGAKLANPDKLSINVWGDAAIGMTGMDLETAVRENVPILSVVLNNSSMAVELPVMPVSTERYRATDISGNYAQLAAALGLHSERVTEPAEIAPAIKRGIAKTQDGQATLLEFITQKETQISSFPLPT